MVNLNLQGIPENYCLIPRFIFQDARLVTDDIVLLTALFAMCELPEKKTSKRKEELLRATGLSVNAYTRAVKRLKKYGWIEKIEKEEGRTEITFFLSLPEKKIAVYSQPGSKIAQAWNECFGTRLIKYEDVQDLKDFVINRGMEEDLVLKIMEYSGRKAKGDPVAYTRAILINLAKNGILTLEDYKKEREKEVSGNGKQFSKTTGGKEKRTPDEIAREYYEKGYR